IPQIFGLAEDLSQPCCCGMRRCEELESQAICTLLAFFDIPRTDAAVAPAAHQMYLETQLHSFQYGRKHFYARRGTLAIEYGQNTFPEYLQCAEPRQNMLENKVRNLVGKC